MSNDPSDNKHAMLAEAEGAPLLKRFGIYTKLSGPGWLQGAITLGGGSLAGALYLGVIAGFGLLWLQPLAMLCGIVMCVACHDLQLCKRFDLLGQVHMDALNALAKHW